MTESRDRAVEVQYTSLEELAEDTRLSLIETNRRVRDLMDPNLPFDLKRQRLAAEFAASAFHLAVALDLAVALEMISPEPEPASAESVVERVSSIVDKPSDNEGRIDGGNLIEDFCSKNKFSERDSEIITKMYEQQSTGDWFKRRQVDIGKIEFPSDASFGVSFSNLTRRLVNLGFLDSNGLEAAARKYKISDKFAQK